MSFSSEVHKNNYYYFVKLEEALPPFIIRKDIPKLFGSIISSKTLANLDAMGLGPSGKFKVGKNVAYPTEELIHWLSQRVKNNSGGELS